MSFKFNKKKLKKGPLYKPTNHANDRKQKVGDECVMTKKKRKIRVTDLIGRLTNIVCRSIELWSLIY